MSTTYSILNQQIISTTAHSLFYSSQAYARVDLAFSLCILIISFRFEIRKMWTMELVHTDLLGNWKLILASIYLVKSLGSAASMPALIRGYSTLGELEICGLSKFLNLLVSQLPHLWKRNSSVNSQDCNEISMSWYIWST